MKWLIASDLHGSVDWCRRLLESFEREGADRMLLLGDILSHGSAQDARTVAGLLDPYAERIYAVRGNCDTEADRKLVRFPMWELYRVFPTGKGPFSSPPTATCTAAHTGPRACSPGTSCCRGTPTCP